MFDNICGIFTVAMALMLIYLGMANRDQMSKRFCYSLIISQVAALLLGGVENKLVQLSLMVIAVATLAMSITSLVAISKDVIQKRGGK